MVVAAPAWADAAESSDPATMAELVAELDSPVLADRETASRLLGDVDLFSNATILAAATRPDLTVEQLAAFVRGWVTSALC